MFFGKKRIGAKELGRSVYNGIVELLLWDPKSDLSYKAIRLDTLKIPPSESLPSSHIVEVIAGILFGAEQAIAERFPFDVTMRRINEGVLEQMSGHFKQLGFEPSKIDALTLHCFSRMDEYFEIYSKSEQIGGTVMLTFAKRFYWNVSGKEVGGRELLEASTHVPLKIAFARESVRKFLNEFKVVLDVNMP